MLGPELVDRGVDAIVSTNAIHLYPDLADTVASWLRVLRPGGHVLVNSGNIRNPRARASEWILDETVWVVGDLAEGLVRTDPRYAAYAADLDDRERMAAHAAYRDRVFLLPRPLDFYLETLELGGLKVESVREASIEARVLDWYELLSAYHDAVLGWVGGTEACGTPSPARAPRVTRWAATSGRLRSTDLGAVGGAATRLPRPRPTSWPVSGLLSSRRG